MDLAAFAMEPWRMWHGWTVGIQIYSNASVSTNCVSDWSVPLVRYTQVVLCMCDSKASFGNIAALPFSLQQTQVVVGSVITTMLAVWVTLGGQHFPRYWECKCMWHVDGQTCNWLPVTVVSLVSVHLCVSAYLRCEFQPPVGACWYTIVYTKLSE